MTFAAILGVASCGLSDADLVSGPCALQVHSVSNESVYLDPAPPYVVVLRPQRFIDTVGPTDISFSGRGWTQTQVTITRPGGWDETEMASGEEINDGFRGWIVNEPGTWRFRLQAGPCLREFALEARPSLD